MLDANIVDVLQKLLRTKNTVLAVGVRPHIPSQVGHMIGQL